jgi:hypothetical protein
MFLRTDRRLAWCCSLLAGMCLLAAAFSWYRSSGPDALLEVAETVVEVDGCVPGERREVAFRLRNHSGQPLRVLGWADC